MCIRDRKTLEQRFIDQNLQMPPKETLFEQVKEQLIIEELQLQLADRAGVKISDAELNSTISRLASNNQMTLEEFISFIENSGDSYEKVRESMRKEMKIQRIQRGRVNSSIEITENEFASFMATDETLEMLEAELQVRQILVKDLSTAEKVLNLLKNNSDFSKLAKDYSISANSSNGGLLDWRKPSEMPELFANALKNKPIGFVSDSLESGAGFHILKLEDKRGEFVQFEEQWLVRHILLSSSAIRNTVDTQKQLNNIRKRIVDNELSFEEAAMSFSDEETTKNNGGVLINPTTGDTRFELTKIDPVLYNQIQRLKDTEISAPLLEEDRTGNKSYKLIKISNRFDEHVADYSKDFLKIKDLALKEKQLGTIQKWMNEKIEETYISVNQDSRDCNFSNKWLKK